MPSGKNASNLPSQPPSSFGEAEGFVEEHSALVGELLDTRQFDQKLELVRNFNLIGSDAGRQQLLNLARRLASDQDG